MIRIDRRDDGVATLTLDHSSGRNAMSTAMWDALAAAVAELAAAPWVRAVVLASGVGGVFCPGADINEFPALGEDRRLRTRMRTAMQTAITDLERLAVPTIAAIDGACVGAGVSMVLACDVRFASAAARFGVTPAKLGLIYAPDDVRRLVAAVGMSQAKRLLFGGELVDAEEAVRIGLVDVLTEGGGCGQPAYGFAALTAANAALTHRATKATIAALARDRRPPAAASARAFEAAFTFPDSRERIAAMLRTRKRR